MIKQPQILPECFGDTTLVNILIKSTSNHKRSISQVFVALKTDFSKRKCIGIIDDDKAKDKYYEEFVVVKETLTYRHLKHPKKHQEIIVLKKDLEHFLVNCAKSVKVEHELTSSVKVLKSHTKKQSIQANLKFKDLINTLIQKRTAPLIEVQAILMNHVV